MNNIKILTTTILVTLLIMTASYAQDDPVPCSNQQLTDTLLTVPTWLLRPEINVNGDRITWTHNGDLTGDNPSNLWGVFLWDSVTGINQITHATSTIGGVQSYIDGSGSRIFFEGAQDLVAGSNPDGNVEEFLWDEALGFLQVTDTTTSLLCGKSISADGNRLFFGMSGEDILGMNPDLNLELFMYDVPTATMTQITSTADTGVCEASPNHNGTEIMFSTKDIIDGLPNPEANSEIYRWVEGEGFSASTNAVSGDCLSVKISNNGQRATISSKTDLVPGSNNSLETEIFLWDSKEGITQLTHSAPGAEAYPFSHDISGNGQRVAFAHTGDLTGRNPDHNSETFL